MPILMLLIIVGFLLYYIVKKPRWLSRGVKGENIVSKKLQGLGDHYIVLNDLLIPGAHGDTQIDHVVVSPFGVFVIETKCWTGWISGGENSDQWTQTIYRKKYYQPNPILQNQVHVESIRLALRQFGVVPVPIIVIVDCDRLLVNSSNYAVIRVNALKSEVLQYNRIIFTDSDCESMAQILLEMSSDDKDRRQMHIQKVQTYHAISKAKVENGICPRCGSTLVLRKGRYGRFYGCSNYPLCKFVSN